MPPETQTVDLTGLPKTTRAQVMIEVELAKLTSASDKELVIGAVASMHGLALKKTRG